MLVEAMRRGQFMCSSVGCATACEYLAMGAGFRLAAIAGWRAAHGPVPKPLGRPLVIAAGFAAIFTVERWFTGSPPATMPE